MSPPVIYQTGRLTPLARKYVSRSPVLFRTGRELWQRFGENLLEGSAFFGRYMRTGSAAVEGGGKVVEDAVAEGGVGR